MSYIIVTGASRGIGLSAVKHLLKETKNTKIITSARKITLEIEQLQKTYDDRVIFVSADFSAGLKDSPAPYVKSLRKALGSGKLESIVFNAGVLDPVGSIENPEASVSGWRHLFEINLFSIVEVLKEFLPDIKATKGRIVYVSSGASTHCYYGWGAYGASKAAVNHLAATVATEEPDVISVSFAPGVVDTSMQGDIRQKFTKSMSKEEGKKFHELHETGGLLPPEVPGTIIANLALRATKSLSGKYVHVGDEVLKEYTY